MQFRQVLLIFAIVIRWTSGERNEFINHKKLKVIENSLDLEANPCENFYQYSCGKWSEQYAELQGRVNNTRDLIGYHINAELVGLMETMSLKDKPEFVRKAYDLYTSCNKMNEDWRASFYIDWMKEHEDITWALMPHSNDTIFDWVHVLGVALRYNVNNNFIQVEVIDKVEGGPTKMVISMNDLFSKTPLFSEESLKALQAKMPEDAKPLEDLLDTIEIFQLRLIGLRLDKYEDKEKKSVSVKDLPLPWLQRIVSLVLNQPSVDDNLELYLKDAEYMLKLDELFQQYDDSFISTYLEIQFLNQFYSEIADFDPLGCMVMTGTLMPLAMNWVYEENHPELKEQMPQVKEIFDNILHDFNETLSSDQSEVVPKEFLQSLNKVQLKVGNLPRVSTVEILEEFYARLSLTNSNFYINHINLYSFAFNAGRYFPTKELATDVDTFFDAHEVYRQTPYWVYFTDILMVPTASLRHPLHHWGYDEVYTYSSIGTHIVRALLRRIGIPKLGATEKTKLAVVASLRSAYKTFFAKYPGALDESQTLHNTEISAKKLFFLNAVQFFCKRSEEESAAAASELISAVLYIPEFSEAFECKTFEYIQLFQ